MRTGVVTTARPEVEQLAVLAEEPGFASFWVYAMALLTVAADNPGSAAGLTAEEPDAVQCLLDRRSTTAADRHAAPYRNDAECIDPADRDLVVLSLIDELAPVDERAELREHIAGLDRAGLDEIVVQPVAELVQLAEAVW